MKTKMQNGKAKRLLGLALALPLMLVMASLRGSLAYAADYSVFVGYADNLRANAANFPTPWAGDPGVTFLGCSPASSCSFDAGAVRIVNNTAGSITIDSVAVHVDTCTFNLWSPSPGGISSLPATIPFGGQIILTQVVSGASAACVSDGTMDTSDVGPGGSSNVGVCTNDNITPTVDVTEDVGGTPVTTTYTDNGQVINTGGIDLASCPSGTNESTQWTSIGSPSCGSAALALSPSAQSHPEGGTATVTATLTCSNTGAPIPGAPVNLAILSGPNAPPTGPSFSPGTTDANGNVSFTYMDPIDNLGTDTLQASVTNLAGTFTSNTVTATWTELPLDCSKAAPSVGQLWPPNHKFVPVTITGIIDPEPLPITTTITSIRQDEPTLEPGSGNFCPDASGIGTSMAQLRAERDGQKDGRVYHIAFSAADSEGATCTGTVTVCVPHDQSNPVGCADEGPLFDSTVCAP